MAAKKYICNSIIVTAITLYLLNLFTCSVDSAACEPIKLPMCYGMPYNMTRMPNLLYHSTQENAKLAIEQFEGLVSTNCSGGVLLFFLCTMYAPICTLDFQMDAIPPCRSVCMQAKAGCEPIMKRYNVSWPSYLACEPLPEYDRGVCISPEAIVNSPPEVIDEDTVRIPMNPERPMWPFFEDNTGGNREEESEDTTEYGRPKKKGSCRQCPNTLKTKQSVFIDQAYEYVIRMTVDSFTRENEFTMYTTVNVIEVLVHTDDILIPTGEVQLWTEDSCICPKIYTNVEYVVMCYQDLYNGRLLLQEDCIVEEWASDDWPRLVKKWNKKLKRAQRLAQEQVVTTRPSSSERRRTSSSSRRNRQRREKRQSRRERAAKIQI